jgi:putative MATE family efflux protein
MRNRDHTRGSVLGSLAVLALPSILMSLVGGALYQLFDLKFVGALGATAIAVVGMTNQTVRQAGFLMVMGTSIATQSMIARLIGEGRGAAAEHVAGQAFFVGGVLAATFALVGGLFPAQLLGWVTNDPIALATGTPYVRLVFLLMAGQIFVPLFASILSAAGETTTPLLITLLSAPVSVFAEWCLIFGHFSLPELGLTGVPWGMATGSVVSLGISFWALFTGRVRIHVRLHHLIPERALLGQLLAIAWQPAMQMVSRTLIVFYFMWLAGHIGTEVQAAYTVGLRLEMIAFMVAFPLANACATLVGQNLGAGNVQRAWRSIRVGMAVEVVVLWAFAAAILLFRAPVVGFFTGDPDVAAIASDYLWYAALGLSYYGLYFIAFRALQAAGDMTAPMLISIGCAVLLGAPLAWYLAVVRTDLGASGMWMANVAYGVVNTTLTVGWLLGGRWTRNRPPVSPRGSGAGADSVG